MFKLKKVSFQEMILISIFPKKKIGKFRRRLNIFFSDFDKKKLDIFQMILRKKYKKIIKKLSVGP